MGGSSSKPEISLPEAPTLDINRATFSGDYAQELVQKAADVQAKAAEAAAAAAAEAENAAFWLKAKLGSGIFFLLALAGVLIWYFMFGPGKKVEGSSTSSPGPATFSVTKATQGSTDVTSIVQSKITNNGLNIPPSVSTNLLSAGASGLKPSDPFVITYQYSDEPFPRTATMTDNTAVRISSNLRPDDSNTPVPQKSMEALPPAQAVTGSSFFSRLGSYFSGSGDTGDQLPNAKVATAGSTIPAGSAPLSAQSTGGYGYQWWMMIDNWDHNFGKEKSVMVRADPSNTAIVNPSVTLHPTENTMRVSVSVYDDESQSTPSTTSSTGDLFTCEIPDVPLQSWFSVSLTLFGRNLDVYLNGRLVKSCLLPGVAKAAAGDIQLNQNNGFAGYMSNFYSYSRMLTPTDAQAFYSAGTSSSDVKSGSPTLSNAITGGYSLKFGLTDTTGKQVDAYTF
jgi:hypothetical protein